MNFNDDFDMIDIDEFLADMDYLLCESVSSTSTDIESPAVSSLCQSSGHCEVKTASAYTTGIGTATATTSNKKRKIKNHKSQTKHKKISFINSLNKRSAAQNQLRLIQSPPLHQPDALMYFPHSMTRFINSGDLQGLSNAMMKYFDNNCYVEFSPAHRWHYTGLLHLFSYTAELHPDSMNYICGTSIDNNCITTSMYYKYTDNPHLTRLIANNIADSNFRNMICNGRGRFLENIPLLKSSFSNNIKKGKEIINSNENIIVYGKVDLVFLLDETSQKVIGLKFLPVVLSIAKAATAAATTEVGSAA